MTESIAVPFAANSSLRPCNGPRQGPGGNITCTGIESREITSEIRWQTENTNRILGTQEQPFTPGVPQASRFDAAGSSHALWRPASFRNEGVCL